MLTETHIESVTLTIARIIAGSTINPSLAEPWTSLLECEQEPLSDLPAFSTLNSEETFAFVLDLCPHLERLDNLWNLHGLTGRELLAYTPQYFVEILTNLVVLLKHSMFFCNSFLDFSTNNLGNINQLKSMQY